MSGTLQRRLEKIRAPFVTAIASRRNELVSAYQLVYRRYVERGFVSHTPGGIVYHNTFGLPMSRTIRTSYHGRTVGTVTVVGDNFNGLQLESTYPLEVERLRGESRALAEVTCLAIEPESEVARNGVFFALTRFMYQYACWRQFDDLLLAIHPRHVRFYERWFRVYRFGPCRPYHLVEGQPAIACRIDLNSVNDVVTTDVRRWYNDPPIAPVEFQRPGISANDHAYFTARANAAVRAAVHRAA